MAALLRAAAAAPPIRGWLVERLHRREPNGVLHDDGHSMVESVSASVEVSKDYVVGKLPHLPESLYPSWMVGEHVCDGGEVLRVQFVAVESTVGEYRCCRL